MSNSVLQRGSDVPHSPVMYAYLIVEIDKAKLFVDTSKVRPEVMDHLENAGIELRPYDSILSEVERSVCDLNLLHSEHFFAKVMIFYV